MPKNMGALDRIIRIVVAAVIAVLFFTNQITGVAAIVLGIIAIIFLLTGIFGFCPIYLPFKINTGKKPA